MKIIGLTGGIGSGKTTVAHLFVALGVPVFFADEEAKRLYEDVSIVKKVIEVLGSDEMIDEHGSIIRQKMAAIIFNDTQKREALNHLIHPLVKKRFDEWKIFHPYAYCIREAAILIESGSYKDCDKIIVVTSLLEKRIERVMERDGVQKLEVEKRINAQMSDEERIKYANFIIENNSGIEYLNQQVLKIHQQLL